MGDILDDMHMKQVFLFLIWASLLTLQPCETKKKDKSATWTFHHCKHVVWRHLLSATDWIALSKHSVQCWCGNWPWLWLHVSVIIISMFSHNLTNIVMISRTAVYENSRLPARKVSICK